MRNAKAGLSVLLFAVVTAASSVQAQTTPKTNDAPVVQNSDVQTAVARALTDLKPGVTLSDHIISLTDIGKYAVAVAVVARPAGTFTGALSHDSITEIYYILKGSGTNVTGKLVDGKPGVSTVVGPSLNSNSPLQETVTRKLGPGDIQVIPAGVGHAFTSVDPGGIEYLVFRMDPDKVLRMATR